MKNGFLFLLALLLFYLGYSSISNSKLITAKAPKVLTARELTDQRVAVEVKSIKEFLKQKTNYNSDLVFLIDMKILSGRNRFFIYDLKKDEVIDRGLVAHGSGSETGIEGKLKFSNVNKSLATSLGKYSIGKSYSGQFGKAYKLYGLDQSNSNACSRNIVLHKYSRMPYEEQIHGVCNSYGCPMVNETYFKRIERILDTSEKEILMVIYY